MVCFHGINSRPHYVSAFIQWKAAADVTTLKPSTGLNGDDGGVLIQE